VNKQLYTESKGLSQPLPETSGQATHSAQHSDMDPTQRGLLQWKHCTRFANQALRDHQLVLAEQGYLKALAYAEQLKAADQTQDPHLAAFVISVHNLADLALQAGKLSQARQWLHRAFTELWQQAQQQPSAVLLPHLQVCRQELAFFCQTFGANPQSTALMQLPWPGLGPGH